MTTTGPASNGSLGYRTPEDFWRKFDGFVDGQPGAAVPATRVRYDAHEIPVRSHRVATGYGLLGHVDCRIGGRRRG